MDDNWSEGFLPPSIVLYVQFVMKWLHGKNLPYWAVLQILVQMHFDTQYNIVLWMTCKWYLLFFKGCLDFIFFIRQSQEDSEVSININIKIAKLFILWSPPMH
jgi:hypothetical protein